MDPNLARAAVDPLTAWVPPLLMTIAMFAFAFAWWRSQRKAEAQRTADEDTRYGALKDSINILVGGFTEMRITLAGFVTVDRHAASVAALHEKINALALLVAGKQNK